MRARRTLTPGQKGTKKLLRRYGPQLVCVCYRYDAERRLRCKTVELIIEQGPWSPTPIGIVDATLMGVRVGGKETGLQRQVKQAGGRVEGGGSRTRRGFEASGSEHRGERGAAALRDEIGKQLEEVRTERRGWLFLTTETRQLPPDERNAVRVRRTRPNLVVMEPNDESNPFPLWAGSQRERA